MSRPARIRRAPDWKPRLEEQERTQAPLEWRLIRRLFTYARPHRPVLVKLMALVLARSALAPLVTWCIGAIIGGPIAGKNPGLLAWSVIGFVLLSLVVATGFCYRVRYAMILGENVVHDLRLAIYRHLLEMPMAFYNRTRLGRVISRFTSDVESVRTGIQQVLFVTIVQGGQMLITGFLLLCYDWVLFLVVLSISPGFWLINRYMRRELSVVLREVQESFSRVTASLAEAVNGMRVTQSYGREEQNAASFRELILDHTHYNQRAAKARATFGPLLELNSQMFLAILVVFGGWRVLRPEAPMRLEDFIQFFFLTNLFFGPIQALSNQYNEALTAMAGAERVFRLLDLQPDWKDDPDAADIPPILGQVEFDHVRFGYEPGKPVLHDLSFSCREGQAVALVGHTGSGKSSIINLLAKFYQPDEGEVRVDGHTLQKVRSESLHRQMGLVLQTNFLFEGTVMENIRFSKPEAGEEEVIEAARRLDVLDLIENLSGGFHTQVGERGSQLAAGERQVVCFVRALLADPRILILDEATSSIDAITEARLQLALGKLLKGRTSFVIAHRLSTIRQADMVLMLKEGRIIEQGNHRELMSKNGNYASLYRSFVRMDQDGNQPKPEVL